MGIKTKITDPAVIEYVKTIGPNILNWRTISNGLSHRQMSFWIGLILLY